VRLYAMVQDDRFRRGDGPALLEGSVRPELVVVPGVGAEHTSFVSEWPRRTTFGPGPLPDIVRQFGAVRRAVLTLHLQPAN
jgi:hypothetical protein